MKKFFLIAILFTLSIAMAGCGGGTGSSSQPSGVNGGTPSVIQLLPIQTIAQTNSSISLKAKVLDGNGNLLPSVPVTFTNLSTVGSLSSTTANTDRNGIATVSLFSSTSGFSTVQSEVNTGAGMVRDKRTVFFSNFDLTVPSPTPAPAPVLTLDVDGNNNGIFNEPSDFILFETPEDNEVIVRATLTTGDIPIPGSLITFGSDTEEGTFPLGDTVLTDVNGQASVLVKVDPVVLRNFNTVLNITAMSDDGASNLVSLFLDPVLIDTLSVSSDLQTVDSGGTANISALLMTTAGTTAPDGTAVSFMTTTGGVTPFSQTTDGIAKATFTAPTLVPGSFGQQATITASSGGKSDTVKITIVAPPAPTPAPTPTPTPVPALVVTPPNATIPCEGATAIFFVTGGVSPYAVQPAVTTTLVTLDKTNLSANGSFTVKSNACASVPVGNNTVNILVSDSGGTVLTVPVTVTNP
ncbi:MAG: Ig-like domain-containing protein [Candidatus Sulfobium sp.]